MTLDEIAKSAGVSRFHLSRAFAASAGTSLSDYIRARRLSEAARSLTQGAPDILTVALDAGYGSHEAFTRAFRQHFGVTPDHLRAQAGLGTIPLQEPIRMNPRTSTVLSTPRIAKAGPLLIFGLGQQYRQTNAGIPAQWNAFVPHLGHIPGQAGNITYGVICNSDDAGAFDYICGVEVRQFPAYPEGFTRLRIPQQTYAVFDHRDHVSATAGTLKAIWEHGLAAANLAPHDGPAFERYDERFDGRTGLGGLEIWIPIAS